MLPAPLVARCEIQPWAVSALTIRWAPFLTRCAPYINSTPALRLWASAIRAAQSRTSGSIAAGHAAGVLAGSIRSVSIEERLLRRARGRTLTFFKSSGCGKFFMQKDSDVADLHALLQRSDFVGALRNKFLGDKTLVAGVDDRLDHGGIINLLRLVDFGAAGHTAGMVMGDERMAGLDSSDEIAFHDLHVVDVVKQLEALRTHAF